jgi:hypothetical protein
MKRLLMIGVAACAFAAMPTLSAYAMPLVAADTLVAGSDSPVILARGGHGLSVERSLSYDIPSLVRGHFDLKQF